MTFKKETLVVSNVKRFGDLSWFPNAHFYSIYNIHSLMYIIYCEIKSKCVLSMAIYLFNVYTMTV